MALPEASSEAEHQLRLALTRAIRARRPVMIEHETGLTIQTVRRFLSGDSVPQRKTMSILWTWASRYGDGQAKDLAEEELRKRGVSLFRGRDDGRPRAGISPPM
jgi:predicted transcriptional regulator